MFFNPSSTYWPVSVHSADRKHRNPSLEDDLWRLFNINKTGKVYGRAAGEGVCKVKDFLKLYHTDEKKLQDVRTIFFVKHANAALVLTSLIM